MQDLPLQKFREAFERQRQANVPSTKGTFFDIPNPSRSSNTDTSLIKCLDSESTMETDSQIGGETPSVLERLLTTKFDPNADRTKHPFPHNIYLAPYGMNGIPASHALNVARAYELSCSGISFFFPLEFTRDLLAIRIGDSRRSIDLCGKILTQNTIETREFGPTNLIDCVFIGRLFLG